MQQCLGTVRGTAGMQILTNLREIERKLQPALRLVEVMQGGTSTEVRAALAVCTEVSLAVSHKVGQVVWSKTVAEALDAKDWSAWAQALVLPGDASCFSSGPQDAQEQQQQEDLKQDPMQQQANITPETQAVLIIRAFVDTLRNPKPDSSMVDDLLSMTTELMKEAASEASHSNVRHDVKALHALVCAAASGVVQEDTIAETKAAMEQVGLGRHMTHESYEPWLQSVA